MSESFAAPLCPAFAPTGNEHPAANPAPDGAAEGQAIFEDTASSVTFIPMNGGHETIRTIVRSTAYMAADGGPPIIVHDTTNVVTTITRSIARGVIVVDSDSDLDSPMDVSSSTDFPADPIRALARAYAAAHASERATHAFAGSASTAATAASTSAAATAASTSAAATAASTSLAAAGPPLAPNANASAGPSRGRPNNRGTGAATRVRKRTFIGPRRETVYIPSSGSEDEAANAAIEDNATDKDNAADVEDEAATAEDVGKGKGKARA